MSELNPFAAFVNEEGTSDTLHEKKILKEDSIISLLERIFAFSLNEDVARKHGYMYIGDLVSSAEKKIVLNKENLSYCLCERLLSISSTDSSSSSAYDTYSNHSRENEVIKYLYECYKIYREEGLDEINDYKIIKDEILKNASTAFIYPDIYSDQNECRQILDIMKYDDMHSEFFKDLCQTIDENDESSLLDIYRKIISLLTSDLLVQHLSTFDMKFFDVLKVLTMKENIAILFMECNEPKKPSTGVSYANTVLGALFNISILPKNPGAEYEHFRDIMTHTALDSMESVVWNKVKLITDRLHLFILSLLKISPAVYNKILNWIGQCIANNSDREKLWNVQLALDFNYTCVSDGFMLQLGNVLLKLSEPFCNKKKILKVDPTYCAVPNDLIQEKNIHLLNMSRHTCILPVEEDSTEQRLMANSYSFISNCFYMTHSVTYSGFVLAVDKSIKMNQEFARLEGLYEASRNGSRHYGDPDSIRERLRTEMTKFLSYKAQLTEPNMLSSMFNFISSSCYWLCLVAIKQDSNDENSYAPNEEMEISFPISSSIPNTLRCIPEFIVNNIICFVNFIKRFNVGIFEEHGLEKLEPILNFLLMFMGNHGCLKNPHLRAELAEGVEALLPVHGEIISSRPRNVGNFQRKKLFAEYKFKLQVVKSLLEVFVGIEMTGQSVEFEQKFNYRRPMYKVMEYLWESEDYQNHFRKLAEEAERNMEAVTPPIFLRFINLLINDAVFLLDDSLTNMSNLRELQVARDEEESTLPANEIAQILGSIRQIGNLARFDNILGRDTITALENLTSKITIVFTHSTMVDRMASMLNYFLFNLVGPNKKNFKVKNPKEFSFEPAETVLKICKIYINLKQSDAFCLAISQDGRSYSPQLFSYAEDVLIRIGGTSYIQEIKELAEKVSKIAEEFQANEEAITGAPENFLDPIMSTLMTDPVILPSSRQTVDRTTIARHLLSDQTDPFNRSPLSMDQVIPDTALANEIREWIAERRSTR